MADISNLTAFNTDPFTTWRSAFRECAKLASKTIDRQLDNETEERLTVWCNVGEDAPYGRYALQGASAGAKFGRENKDNIDELKKINDFKWLETMFNK
jgi:hypothetical protein